MKEKFECPICGYMNLARKPAWKVPLACKNCGHNVIIVEEEDDVVDDEE